MARLTKSTISAMAEAAVTKAGVPQALAALDERTAVLTEEIRIEALGGPAEVARLEQIDVEYRALVERAGNLKEASACNDRLVNIECALRVNLAGVSVRLGFPEGARMCPRAQHVIQQGSPHVDEFYAIRDARKELDAKADSIRAAVNAACTNVTTVAKLLDLWPEAAELLPAETDAPKAGLPAINTVDLNKLLGLPSESK